MLTGCLAISDFKAWSPPKEFDGEGGAFVTKQGIDIYSAGTPKKRCLILGIINSTVISSAELTVLFGNSWSTDSLVKEAKARGGNAVILTDKSSQILGWSSSGMAMAHQSGNTAMAYGNSQTSATISSERVAVLVKYVGEIQEQNVTQETEDKLLGHWRFVPPSTMPIRGQLDFYFLPQKRIKIVSTLLNKNGQPLLPTPELEGRYYITGNKLVTWGDKDEKPDSPMDCLVSDTRLIVRNQQFDFMFQKLGQADILP